MSESTFSVPQERNASVAGQQVRFLDRDPVPPSLRGKEGRLEQMTEGRAAVWVDGILRRVPKRWLRIQRKDSAPLARAATVAAAALDASQGSTSPPTDPDAEGDDDVITEQAWYSLLEVCLELNLNREEAQQVIAEAVGVPLGELDPSRLTWRQYLQAIERLEQLEAAQGQSADPPPLPPPLPPTAKREEVAKVIYPPPSRYLGLAAYNELVVIAANLGLNEEAMVARLGIPADCPGYLLDRVWVFASVRGLAAIAAGQQPGPLDFSNAVLKFGYCSDDGPRLVVVGLDGTLLHGDPAIVLDWAQQLRIPVGNVNIDYCITRGQTPLSVTNRDLVTLGGVSAQQLSLSDSKACLPVGEDALVTEQNWRALKIACRKARMHPIQMLKFIAGAAGIPVCRLGRTSLTWKQYQDVIVHLEEYQRRGLAPSPPLADAEDDRLISEQAWDLLQEACRDLGLERWQAQQLITEATGIPPSSLESSRLTERQYMQVFERLEELEVARTRPPLSHPLLPLARPYPQWIDVRLAGKPQKKRSKKSRSAPKGEGISPWLWDGGLDEE